MLECFKIFNFNLLIFADSSNNGSPRRQKRPLAIVGDNQLPAITESTELVSLNGSLTKSSTKPQWSNGYRSPSAFTNSADMAGTVTSSNHTTNNSNPYKFDPKVLSRAEHLLGKVSLDGPDVTITSLNFIDADSYGQPVSNSVRPIQDFFDRNHSLRSPKDGQSPK